MHERRNNPEPERTQTTLTEEQFESLSERFETRYNRSFNGQVYFCPGRINLIGEHIDYNGGHVLPSALSLGIYALVEQTDAERLRFRSTGFSPPLCLPVSGTSRRVSDPEEWRTYPEGVVRELSSFHLTGCDVLFHSTLPVGRGLSSSAALEVLTAYLLLDQSDERMDRAGVARLCHRVENEFVGVQCGIMDQFAVALCRKNHALLLNCRSETFTHVPFSPGEHRFVVMDTNKQRELSDSAYNQRRRTCEEALRQLQEHAELTHLCDASLELIEDHLTDPTLLRRARHVVTEQNRVRNAADALENREITKFGHLMNSSHDSLRDDYDVTGRELDSLVDAARGHEGCAGARMTGAGFGGSAIALVRNPLLASFKNHVEEQYETEIGLLPDFYETTPEEGVHRMRFRNP